jgi:hypothetical protein
MLDKPNWVVNKPEVKVEKPKDIVKDEPPEPPKGIIEHIKAFQKNAPNREKQEIERLKRQKALLIEKAKVAEIQNKMARDEAKTRREKEKAYKEYTKGMPSMFSKNEQFKGGLRW